MKRQSSNLRTGNNSDKAYLFLTFQEFFKKSNLLLTKWEISVIVYIQSDYKVKGDFKNVERQ